MLAGMTVSRSRTTAALEVLTVTERIRAAQLPPAPWFFAAAMAASTAVAVFAGLVLGFLAAMELSYGQSHWSQAVQAHGRLQLFGWVSVFVVALAFEFAVRFHGTPLIPTVRRLAVLLLLGVGALAGAAGQVWYDHLEFLWVAGQGAVLAGALGAAWLTFRACRPRHPLLLDLSPLWFNAGMAWLAVSAGASFATALGADLPVATSLETHFAAEVFLRGFLLNIILIVGLRAFAGHVGLPQLSIPQQRFVFALTNGSVMVWVLASGAYFLPDSETGRLAGDAGLALALLAFTGWFRIFGPRPDLTGGPRYRVLIPIAWSGAAIYALVLLALVVASPWFDPDAYQSGAVRHILLLGFVAPLMAAMAHVVLARFGLGYIPSENLLTTGFVFLMAAWPLRVVPPLVDSTPGDMTKGLMGLAAVLAFSGLGLMATVAGRTALAIRARHRAMARAAG